MDGFLARTDAKKTIISGAAGVILEDIDVPALEMLGFKLQAQPQHGGHAEMGKVLLFTDSFFSGADGLRATIGHRFKLSDLFGADR